MNRDIGKKESNSKRTERLLKDTVRSVFASLARRRRNAGYPINADLVKRVLVIRQHNQFGDVLCTVPLLRALRNKFSLDELAVVVSPQNIAALTGCDYVTKLINYDKLSFYRRPTLFLKFVRQLRAEYDLLLVPSNVSISLTNDIIAFFAKAKIKIGPASIESRANKTASIYDISVDLSWDDKLVHQYYRNMKIAEPLGITGDDQAGGLEFTIDGRSSADVHGLFDKLGRDGRKKIAIHAGAGKEPNRWNVDKFAALLELLSHELNADIFITEGPLDHEAIDKLVNLVKAPFVRVRDRAINYVAAILKEMDLVVTNDTGIMHLAAAVGTPTLSLFGPTDPLQWAPLGSKHGFILGKGGDINTIDVTKVFHSVLKLLKGTQN